MSFVVYLSQFHALANLAVPLNDLIMAAMAVPLILPAKKLNDCLCVPRQCLILNSVSCAIFCH